MAKDLPEHLGGARYVFGGVFVIEFFCLLAILAVPERGAELFQRFGSLVVCMAIFLAGSGRLALDFWERNWVEKKVKNQELMARFYLRIEMALAKQFGADDEYVQRTKAENAESLEALSPKKTMKRFDESRRHLGFSEMGVLLLGTIQWGFGDLVYNSITRIFH